MANAKNSLIVITDEKTGETKTIRTKAVRIAEFLEKYPPKDYRLVVDVCDELFQRKGLLELYKIQLGLGKKPEEVGLPSIDTYSDMIFTASLYNNAGEEVRRLSSKGTIQQYKDHERFETAAILRLFDFLGCGSDLDSDPGNEDELLTDLREQGLRPEVVPANSAATPIVSSPKTTPEGEQERPLSVVPTKAPATAPRDGKPSAESTLLSLQRMIMEQAARHQIPVKDIPEITDKSLATRLLKALMQAKSTEAAKEVIELAKAA